MNFTPEQLEAFAKAVPFANHLGVRMTELSQERVVCEVTAAPEHCTTASTVHGGFLMAVADYAGACGAYMNLPEGAQGTTTTESKTNMLRPGPPGVLLTATAMPVHLGKRLQVWQTRIEADGKLLSLTTQSQMTL